MENAERAVLTFFVGPSKGPRIDRNGFLDSLDCLDNVAFRMLLLGTVVRNANPFLYVYFATPRTFTSKEISHVKYS